MEHPCVHASGRLTHVFITRSECAQAAPARTSRSRRMTRWLVYQRSARSVVKQRHRCVTALAQRCVTTDASVLDVVQTVQARSRPTGGDVQCSCVSRSNVDRRTAALMCPPRREQSAAPSAPAVLRAAPHSAPRGSVRASGRTGQPRRFVRRQQRHDWCKQSDRGSARSLGENNFSPGH